MTLAEIVRGWRELLDVPANVTVKIDLAAVVEEVEADPDFTLRERVEGELTGALIREIHQKGVTEYLTFDQEAELIRAHLLNPPKKEGT